MRNPSTCYINKLYISRIYRKLKYAHLIYIKTIINLFDKFRNIDKVTLRMNSRCNDMIKFLYTIGFRLELVE